MRYFLVKILLLVHGVHSENITQYLAMAPDSGLVTWMQATFPSNYTATSAEQVSFETISNTVDEIGAWQTLDMGGMPLLTIKTKYDVLYSQLNTGIAPYGPSDDGYYPGGCCVDTFIGFNIDPTIDDINYDIESIVFDIYENVTDLDINTGKPYAYVNHVFDMTSINDEPIAVLDVTYHEPLLNYGEVDSVMLFNTITGQVVPTIDGKLFFSFFENLGTTSITPSDSIYKIYYENVTSPPEQYHMNGVSRFQTNDGTWVLGATFRASAECILIKDPYTYSSINDGGGTILQRFGSPTSHRFGYSTNDGNINALHNLWYTSYLNEEISTNSSSSSNRETVTLFVNTQDGYTNSRVFEFDIKLTPEPTTSYDDTVFDTDYISGTVSYWSDGWGGARPIGVGVWMVGLNGYTAIDTTSPDSDSSSTQVKAFNMKKKSALMKEDVVSDIDDDKPPPPPDDDGGAPHDDDVPPTPRDDAPPSDDKAPPPGDDDDDKSPPTGDDENGPVPVFYDGFTFITAA